MKEIRGGLPEKDANRGFWGVSIFFLIVLVLCVAVLLDRLLNTGTWVFRTLACYFYIANEGISILENVVVLGLPIPEQLKNALIQIQDKSKPE